MVAASRGLSSRLLERAATAERELVKTQSKLNRINRILSRGHVPDDVWTVVQQIMDER